MIIEVLLSVRPDWENRIDLGTIVSYSKIRSRTYLSKEEAELSGPRIY